MLLKQHMWRLLSQTGCSGQPWYLRLGHRCLLSAACDALQQNWLSERDSVLHDHQQFTAKQEGHHKAYDSVEFLSKLSRQFNARVPVSAYDLDVAIHGIDDVEQLAELEKLLYKFRRSPNNSSVLPSTPDAVFRCALAFKRPQFAANLLTDTLNYGVFPDATTSASYMQHCVQHDMLTEACQTAVYLMQQELASCRLSLYLSVFVCSKWAQSRWSWDEWVQVDEEEEEDYTDMDDEVLFRVPWLKNPYFDDHFDLESPRHSVGKTLYWAGTELALSNPSSEAALNAAFLGACMWGRSARALKLLETWPSDAKLLKSVHDLCLEIIELQQEQANEDAKAEIDTDDLQVLPKYEFDSAVSWQPVKDALSKASLREDQSLVELVEHAFKAEQEGLEADLVKRHAENLTHWSKRRRQERDWAEELRTIEQELGDIDIERQNLHRRRELLNFFEHREEYEKLADLSLPDVSFKKTTDEQVLDDDEYAQVLTEQFQRQRAGFVKRFNPGR